MQLTSRERVRKAINFEEPDRVPVGIGSTFVTGIHMDAYVQLVNSIGLDLVPPKVIDQGMMVVRPDLQIMEWLGSDVIGIDNVVHWCNDYANKDWKVWRNHKGNDVLVPGGFNTVRDEKGYTYAIDKDGKRYAYMSPDGQYFENAIGTNFSNDIVFADSKEWKASLPVYRQEHLELLEKRAKFYHEYTDYSINGGFTRKHLFGASGIAGHTYSDLLCLIASEPEYMTSIVMAQTEWQLEQLEMYLQAVGPYIDTILMSTADFGAQNCELFNPEQFRTIYMPAFKILNDYVHKHSHAKTMYHSCGSIRNILKYFVEAGVDIINPVQTSASGMDPAELKKEFGKKLVFWGGGADTQHTLPQGTPEEVRQEVRERIQTFAPGGGFVFSPVHNLQSDVPFENIKGMVDAVREFGRYPININ